MWLSASPCTFITSWSAAKRQPGHRRRLTGQVLHVPHARLGIIRPAAGQRRGQRHRPAEPDLTRRRSQPPGRDVVQSAAAVLARPWPAVTQPRIQCAETVSGQIGSSISSSPTRFAGALLRRIHKASMGAGRRGCSLAALQPSPDLDAPDTLELLACASAAAGIWGPTRYVRTCRK